MKRVCFVSFLLLFSSHNPFAAAIEQGTDPETQSIPGQLNRVSESHEGETSSLKTCPAYCASEHFFNVPEAWETDFRRVIGNLTSLLGFFDIDIVAWPDTDKTPTLDGQTIDSGQYIGGHRNLDGQERTLMVLEIVSKDPRPEGGALVWRL